jgi:hypothetical protein
MSVRVTHDQLFDLICDWLFFCIKCFLAEVFTWNGYSDRVSLILRGVRFFSNCFGGLTWGKRFMTSDRGKNGRKRQTR